MCSDTLPGSFAPRTHSLTLGELRKYIESVAVLPNHYLVRDMTHQPFKVYEHVEEAHGVEVFNTTNAISLPIN